MAERQPVEGGEEGKMGHPGARKGSLPAACPSGQTEDQRLVKERPILFSGPMVRALLAGTKTQTRRVVKGEALRWLESGLTPEFVASAENGLCPYGYEGQLLWVRETFGIGEDLGEGREAWMEMGDRFILYAAGGGTDEDYCVPRDYEVARNAREDHHFRNTAEHWRSFGPMPSIHMPRWASRLTLEITYVRVERLQDITEADAAAEGSQEPSLVPIVGACWSERGAYAKLWEHINGAGSWAANPWVWVVSFHRVQGTCSRLGTEGEARSPGMPENPTSEPAHD